MSLGSVASEVKGLAISSPSSGLGVMDLREFRRRLKSIGDTRLSDAANRLNEPLPLRYRAERVARMVYRDSETADAATRARSRLRSLGLAIDSRLGELTTLSPEDFTLVRYIASRGDRAIGRDLAADVLSLPLDRIRKNAGAELLPHLKQLDAWARQDLGEAYYPRFEQALSSALGDSDKELVGLAYYGYLSNLWYRMLVTVAAVLIDEDDLDVQLRRAVTTLPVEGVDATRGAAEAFTTAIGIAVGEHPTGLSREEEAAIDSHLNSLRGYYLVASEVPRVLIQKPIEEIVRILAGRLVLGNEARQALVDLGARPEEVVDAVLDRLNDAIRSISQWNAEDNREPLAESSELRVSQVHLNEALDTVAGLEQPTLPESAETCSPRNLNLKEEFKKSVVSSAGKRTTDIVVAGLSGVAVLTFGSWASAAARLINWLVEYLPWALR